MRDSRTALSASQFASTTIRVFTLTSAVAATLVLVTVVPGPVRLPTVLLSVAGLLSGFASGLLSRVLLGVILSAVYLTPSAFRWVAGHNYYAYSVCWMAALLGMIITSTRWQGWRLPARWTWPIATWALVIAASWPLTAWRELDYTFGNLWDSRLPVASAKISAPKSVEWVAHNALVYLLGLLLLDWLCAKYGRNARQFRKDVVTPLVVAIVLSCAVGAYQAFVDIGFLSGHAWPTLRRAAGTLMDANVFGVLAALWGPALVILAAASPSRPFSAAYLSAVPLSWTAVWASGSRTAALTAVVGTMLALPWLLRTVSSARGKIRWAIGAGVGVAAFGFFIASVPSLTVSALERARYLIPETSLEALRYTVGVLWSREGYGSAAWQMIREHPWAGVGVGTFNTLAPDFAAEVTALTIPPDNSQNWFRHQLAELGIVGSLGWAVWVLVFAWDLWRVGRGTPMGPGTALRGPLTALALASLVGMPGQDPAVAVTFWVFVFWYGADASLIPDRVHSLPAKAWMAALLIVAAYSAICAVPDNLRPPFRAARFDFVHSYGFDFESAERTWTTASRAVTVLRATEDHLRLTYWVNHPDADTRPVRVQIWRNDDQVVNRRLRRGVYDTILVPVPNGKRFVLEVKIDRTFRPSDGGSTETGERGLSMRWEFIGRPQVGGNERNDSL